jgi:hypothetical protein
MDILKYVDIFIGLALVMVLGSTVVAAVTQIITACTYARARYLRDGVTELVKALDPKLKDHAPYVAELVLRHPMIARSNTWFGSLTTGIRNRFRATPLPSENPAEVIQREELIRILLEIASGKGPLTEFVQSQTVQVEKAKKALDAVRDAVSENGVPDAAFALSAIRRHALQEEQSNPQLTCTERHSRAVIATAGNELTGKVFSWFDNTMQRVSDHFTLEAKIWTSAVALLVVLSIQLDSAQLLRRLSQDEKYRQGLVEQAKTLDLNLESARGAPPENMQEIESRVQEQREKIDAALATMRTPTLEVIPDHLVWQRVLQVQFDPKKHVTDTKEHKLELQVGEETTSIRFGSDPIPQIRAGLAEQGAGVRTYEEKGVIRIAALSNQVNRMVLKLDGNAIANGYAAMDLGGLYANWPGLALSWVLLSLGAPFWFDALKNLLKFRSVLAQREDKERANRTEVQAVPQTTTAAPASAAAAAAANDEDETGDLKATGAAA